MAGSSEVKFMEVTYTVRVLNVGDKVQCRKSFDAFPSSVDKQSIDTWTVTQVSADKRTVLMRNGIWQELELSVHGGEWKNWKTRDETHWYVVPEPIKTI